MSTEANLPVHSRIAFQLDATDKNFLLAVSDRYHISLSELLRLYILWLKETGSVPLGLPDSIYPIP